MEIQEVRGAHRAALNQAGGDNEDRTSQKWRAKEELLRSYQEKEAQLHDALKRKEEKADELYSKLRALKRYARQLKYLGEDLSPIG